MSRRLYDWMGLLGIVLSMAVGLLVGTQSLLKPLNWSLYDRLWAGAYVAALALVGLLCWLRAVRFLIALTLAAAGLFVVLTVVRAGTGPALLVVTWLMVVAAAAGDWMLARVAPSVRDNLCERLLFAVLTGLGGLALLTLGLGVFRLLYPLVGYTLLGTLTLLLVPSLIRSLRPAARLWRSRLGKAWQAADLRLHGVVLAGLTICWWGGLVWALAPSVHYDALVYHLAAPAVYVREHAVVEILQQYRTYWAHNAEMLYTLSLLLVGQPMPALVHLTFGVLGLGLTSALGWRVAGMRAALFGGLLFYSIPLVTWESGTAYADLVVSVYVFASLYAGLMWWLRCNKDWLVLAGMMAGLGVGTKLNAVVVLVPVCFLLVSGLLFRHGLSRRSWLALFCFAAPAAILAMPWFLRDWLWTGNPVFPFMNSIFRSTKWSSAGVSFRSYGQGKGVVEFLRLPWDLVVHVRAFDIQAVSGAAGAIPLLALPWLYLNSGKKRQVSFLLLLPLGLALIVWFWAVQNLRYLLPVFPLLAVLAALNIDALCLRFSEYRQRKLIAALGLVALLSYLATTRFVATVWQWQILDRYPYRLALGFESAERFLSRTLPIYDVYRYLAQQGPEQRILAVGTEQWLYTEATIEPVHGSRDATRLVTTVPPGRGLAQMLDDTGYDYVLIERNVIDTWPQAYAKVSVLDESFLSEFSRIEFADRGIHLYRILPDGVSSVPSERKAQELLSNGGFEVLDEHGMPDGWVLYGRPTLAGAEGGARTGRVAVRVDARAWLYQEAVAEPGRLYTLGHWTRADGPGQLARLQVNWLDEDSELVRVSIEVVPVDTEWECHRMMVTVPLGAAYAHVYVSVHGDSTVWFDDVSLVAGD